MILALSPPITLLLERGNNDGFAFLAGPDVSVLVRAFPNTALNCPRRWLEGLSCSCLAICVQAQEPFSIPFGARNRLTVAGLSFNRCAGYSRGNAGLRKAKLWNSEFCSVAWDTCAEIRRISIYEQSADRCFQRQSYCALFGAFRSFLAPHGHILFNVVTFAAAALLYPLVAIYEMATLRQGSPEL